MGIAITIACLPYGEEGQERRSSRNFSVNQLPNEGHLKWQVISRVGDTEIYFDVKQKGPNNTNITRYEQIRNGTITDYEALRNLYIANPRNATGHFLVRVESCE